MAAIKKKKNRKNRFLIVKVKYLHKVYLGGGLLEQYTWSDQKQLTHIDFPGNYTSYQLTYAQNKRLDSIYFSYPFRQYSGKFYYDEQNRVGRMDYRHHYYGSDYESQQINSIRYSYARNGKIDKVDFILGNSIVSVIFKWRGKNMLHIIDGFSGTYSYDNYDSLANPYRTMPKIVLLGMAELAYRIYPFTIASENNCISVNHWEYKYDYDTDGYPILSYVKENGEWKEFKRYEYLPE